MAYSEEFDYIFSLIIQEENMGLLSIKNKKMVKFFEKVYSLDDKVVAINLFDQQTLIVYDNTIRLLAHLIFEKVPEEFNIHITKTPSAEEFKKWLASITNNDYVSIIYFLSDIYLLNLEEDKLIYMLNVYHTNKGLES